MARSVKGLDIYLTDELKTKYQEDFVFNVLENKIEFWRLDEGLGGILKEINKNKNIQTLYSKKWQPSSMSATHDSYLKVCFKEEIELKIFRKLIPFLLARHNDKYNNSSFNYTYNLPSDNANHSEKPSRINLACIYDKDYFRINNIRFDFEGMTEVGHEKFWDDIKTQLSKI